MTGHLLKDWDPSGTLAYWAPISSVSRSKQKTLLHDCMTSLPWLMSVVTSITSDMSSVLLILTKRGFGDAFLSQDAALPDSTRADRVHYRSMAQNNKLPVVRCWHQTVRAGASLGQRTGCWPFNHPGFGEGLSHSSQFFGLQTAFSPFISESFISFALLVLLNAELDSGCQNHVYSLSASVRAAWRAKQPCG